MGVQILEHEFLQQPIHNSPQMSIHMDMNECNGVHLHSGVLFSHKKDKVQTRATVWMNLANTTQVREARHTSYTV